MSDRKAAKEERARQEAAEHLAEVRAFGTQRRAAWASWFPAGTDVPYLDRLRVGGTIEDAYAVFVLYAVGIGLRPEDTFGVTFEGGEGVTENTPRHVGVLYRD